MKIAFRLIAVVFFAIFLSLLPKPMENLTNIEINRLSLSETLIQPDSESWDAAISTDGRYATFYSASDKLIDGDSNKSSDLFLFNFDTGELTKISKNEGVLFGISTDMGASLSSDGKFIAFTTGGSDYGIVDTNTCWDIYVYNREEDTYERVSESTEGNQGNNYSRTPVISEDGRFVAFSSASNNLDGYHYDGGTYIHDRLLHITKFLASGYARTPSMSSDGNLIAFQSNDNTLVPNDINNEIDAFVYDQLSKTYEIVDVNNVGVIGNYGANSPSISGNGRYVAFMSASTNLLPDVDINGKSQIFVHDRSSGENILVSVSNENVAGNGTSWYPKISQNGRYVVFESYATNLVDDNNNYCGSNLLENCHDVFARDLWEGVTYKVSITSTDQETNGNSKNPAISGDGLRIVYESQAYNILPGDTNGYWDIYSTTFIPDATVYLPIVLKQ